MAKFERAVEGDFKTIVDTLHTAEMDGSASASFEEESDMSGDGYDCAVRVYERYSWFGGNRVSMVLAVAGANGKYKVTAVTSGGSRAVFFKVNRVGESAFLDTVVRAIEKL